mmetsp:Transcript_2027/g.7328  ORF Transcript_2027/g.7328 Transcript_2027/m.7328 type:complete len:225 (+) Transcript_2027:910-1584(+)
MRQAGGRLLLEPRLHLPSRLERGGLLPRYRQQGRLEAVPRRRLRKLASSPGGGGRPGPPPWPLQGGREAALAPCAVAGEQRLRPLLVSALHHAVPDAVALPVHGAILPQPGVPRQEPHHVPGGGRQLPPMRPHDGRPLFRHHDQRREPNHSLSSLHDRRVRHQRLLRHHDIHERRSSLPPGARVRILSLVGVLPVPHSHQHSDQHGRRSHVLCCDLRAHWHCRW